MIPNCWMKKNFNYLWPNKSFTSTVCGQSCRVSPSGFLDEYLQNVWWQLKFPEYIAGCWYKGGGRNGVSLSFFLGLTRIAVRSFLTSVSIPCFECFASAGLFDLIGAISFAIFHTFGSFFVNRHFENSIPNHSKNFSSRYKNVWNWLLTFFILMSFTMLVPTMNIFLPIHTASLYLLLFGTVLCCRNGLSFCFGYDAIRLMILLVIY